MRNAVPPRKKQVVATPSTASTMKELKDTLWKAADKLRGSMDASQYKGVILGLEFLKYVSDAFHARRAEIAEELAGEGYTEEQAAPLLEDGDECGSAGVLCAPQGGRPGRGGGVHRAAGGRGDDPAGAVQPDSACHVADDLQPRQRGPAPAGGADRPVPRGPVLRGGCPAGAGRAGGGV